MDSRLRKHCVDVDDGTSIAHVKLLLSNMSLVPAGFVPTLVYQKRMLGDHESVGSFGYNPELNISLVCVRSSPASIAMSAADPELRSSLSTESNASAAAQKATESPTAPAGCAAADTTPAAADDSAVSEARHEIFSMGFDEALVQRALARSGGNEQSAIDMIISGSGQLHLDDVPTLSSSPDSCVPVLFSMGFDDALVRRALSSAGGDEEIAVDLLLSGRVLSSDDSAASLPDFSAAASAPAAIRSSGCSISCPKGHICLLRTYADEYHACALRDDSAFATACGGDFKVGDQGYRCDVCDYHVCLQCYSAFSAAPALTGAIANQASAAAAQAAPAVNVAFEWLDEFGCICPKVVDYASQCPKGHALVPFTGGGGGASAQRLLCRVCHTHAESEQAPQWLVCSATGCCAGYAVCNCCVRDLQQTTPADPAGEGFSFQVSCAAGAACCFGSCLLLQGVSLQYLRWLNTQFGPSLGRLTTSQFEKMYLRPQTSRRRSSVADELAAHAATAHHVSPATWFISHTWSNAFADTLEAILHFFEERVDADAAVIWMDVFVDSQHADTGSSKSPQWYMTTFKNSIARIGRLLLVADKWNDPTALRRAW